MRESQQIGTLLGRDNLDASPGPRSFRWPRDPFSRVALWFARAGLHAAFESSRVVRSIIFSSTPIPREQVDARAAAWLDNRRWPVRPLRVGIDERVTLAESIVAAPGANVPIEFFSVPARTPDAQVLMAARTLDAILRPIDGVDPASANLELITREAADRPAGLADWGAPGLVSYASVFPLRLDASRVTLREGNTPESPVLLRAIIESAAALSRTPMRLDFDDRLRGRRPALMPRRTPTGRFTRLSADAAFAERAILRLCDLVRIEAATTTSAAPARPALRVAARLAGAWMSTGCGVSADVDRRAVVEAAAELLHDEPESLLRLAAVRLALSDHAGGISALEAADRLLARDAVASDVDSSAFIQAELHLSGAASSAAVGRVAAGICILTAGQTAEQLRFVRDDFFDDLSRTRLLVGREQDHRLIRDVFDALLAVRECATKPQPAASGSVFAAAQPQPSRKRPRRAA